MTTYENGKDNGRQGKNFEVAVRMFITPKTRAQYCKSMRMVDHFIKLDGKRVNIEIKLGAGTLDYNRLGTLDTSIPATDHIANVYANAQFIVYAPSWDGDADEIGDNAWVMTRAQFIEMLEGYKGMVKYNNKSGTKVLQMQSFSNSEKREGYIWDCLADAMTLGEWKESIG